MIEALEKPFFVSQERVTQLAAFLPLAEDRLLPVFKWDFSAIILNYGL